MNFTGLSPICPHVLNGSRRVRQLCEVSDVVSALPGKCKMIPELFNKTLSRA